jgi:PAS domain S-box-containing protein
LYGNPPDGINSRDKWLSSIHTDDRKKVIKCFEDSIKTGANFNIEFRVVWPDNSIHYLTTKAQLFKDKQGKPLRLVGINIDISPQKFLENNLVFLSQASKALASSLDYQTTLNTVAELAVPYVADWCAVDLLNESGQLKQVIVKHTNPKKVQLAKKLRKISPPDMNGSVGIAKVIKTGEAEFLPHISIDLLRSMAKDAKHLEILKQIGFTSAMIVPIKSHKKEAKIVGVITLVSAEAKRQFNKYDLVTAEELSSRIALAIENSRLYTNAQQEIKDRKKIENELMDSKHQLEIIFQNVADGITVQTPGGQLLFVNEAAAKASGYNTPQEMMSDPSRWIKDFELFDEEGNGYNLSTLPGRRALSGELNAQDLIRFVDKNTQEERWSLIKARPVFDGKKNVQLVINIIQDITDRVQKEKRMDEFVALASHELKTPVTSLKMFTQVMQQRFQKKNDKESELLLSKMDNQLTRLVDLIKSLLDISRVKAGKISYEMETFSINDLIQEVVDSIKNITKTHTIIVHEQTKHFVYADRERIGQVLINLINNAIKYSPKSDNIIVSIKKEKKYIVISIQDFGVGIPKADQEKVFDKFFQTSKSDSQTFPGLGLGLYISSEIVKRHKGTIWVESEEGKGTTFSFTLPSGSRRKAL